MSPANFSFLDWEVRTNATRQAVPELNARELPQPIDTYRPGAISWGKDPKRGRAIQRSRSQKRFESNKAHFLAHVLPLIENELNPRAWRELAQALQMPELYARGGWVRYVLGERASWVHESETEKIAQCVAMGAKPEGTKEASK